MEIALRCRCGRLGRFGALWNWLITFHVVCIAWIFFRAETFSQAAEMLTGLVTNWGTGDLVKPMLVFVVVAMVAAQFVPPRVVEAGQVAFSRAAPAGGWRSGRESSIITPLREPLD